MITTKDNFIYISTPQTLLVFEIVKIKLNEDSKLNSLSYIVQNYYGPSKDINEIKHIVSCFCPFGSNDEYNLDPVITTSYGMGNNTETSILLRNYDGTNINRFYLKKCSILKGGIDVKGPHSRNVQSTLEIIEVDNAMQLELHTYYSIFQDCDVIAVKRKLVNKSNNKVEINRLFSLECPVPSKDVTISTYDGKWLFERTRHQTRLTSGVYSIDSKLGSSSHKHNPFIKVKDNENNLYYGFNFIYSGNHKEIVEVNHLFHSQVFVGINDFGFAYSLKKNEFFTTPEAIMCIGLNDDEITKNMHSFVTNHLVDPNFKYKSRPILFNSWEGTEMNVNESNLNEMAEIASSVGIELFVMDDGWFYNRNDDKAGLGDWFIDKTKFPNGLSSFTKGIRKEGLKFGIWVEPEMINKNTKLFKKHPEFACIIPSRDPIERRHQLMIDMSNPKVVRYLFNCLVDVINETKAEYVKWDYNRFFMDSYSNYHNQNGDYGYNFIMGTYSLIEQLKEQFPLVLFESCSSGGGRYDLGMLYYMPQTWASDDTNSYCRSFISCGTLTAYPQSTFGAHVSIDGCPIEGKNIKSSIEDRFNIHSTGAFGYEFDFRKINQRDRKIIVNQVEYYKAHRDLFQFGQYYCVDNCFDDNRYYSYTLVSYDKSEAMMFVAELEPNVPAKAWKAKGLDEKALYEIEMRSQYNLSKKQVYTGKLKGKELMNKGLRLGSLDTTSDKKEYNGIFSRLIYLRKVDD